MSALSDALAPERVRSRSTAFTRWPMTFRSSPMNRHSQCRPACLKSAQTGALFVHIVRTGEKGHRNVDIEQFRCLEIYEKQEFGGLLNRKLGRFSAFERIRLTW
jgi:hypothetical protein